MSFADSYKTCPHCGYQSTGYPDYRLHWRDVHGGLPSAAEHVSGTPN